MFARLDTVILRVRDLAAARAWYARNLGLEAVYVDDAEALAVLGLDGTSLTLWQLKAGEQPVTAGQGTFPIFSVGDARAAYEQLYARGARVDALQDGAGVRFFSFYDPDGNRLEACEVIAAEAVA